MGSSSRYEILFNLLKRRAEKKKKADRKTDSKYIERQTDRHIDREADKHTERSRGRQTDRSRGRQKDRSIDR